MRRILQKADLNFGELQEIRMRINSPLMIRQRGKEYKLTEEGKLLRCNGNEQYEKENIHYVDRCELMETMEYIAGYSLYAYEDELRQGFLTIQGRTPCRCRREDPDGGREGQEYPLYFVSEHSACSSGRRLCR